MVEEDVEVAIVPPLTGNQTLLIFSFIFSFFAVLGLGSTGTFLYLLFGLAVLLFTTCIEIRNHVPWLRKHIGLRRTLTGIAIVLATYLLVGNLLLMFFG
jgi:hypothetical protein